MYLKSLYDCFKRALTGKISGLKWFCITAGVSFGIVGTAALVVFVVDPYYRYRMPFFYDTVYYKVYATAPRLLTSQEYDLLMLGTSMTRNFFIDEIDKTFNCRSIKLAASGGTVEDLRKFFDIAAEARGDRLKQVVLSLDIYSLNKNYNHWQDFDYLYRKDHKEDYRYLFSKDSFSSIHYLIKRKTNPKRQRKHQSDRNRMFATEYKGKPYGLAEVIKDAIGNEAVHHTQTPAAPAVFQKNLYKVLLPVFDAHPDIRFTVYLPPYHIYTYCQSEHFKEADGLIKQRTMVMLELLKRPNVTLYDFQSDRKYVTCHDYFSDVQHFSNTAAKMILNDLKSGRRKISTKEQVLANEKELRQLISEMMPVYYAHLKQFKGK